MKSFRCVLGMLLLPVILLTSCSEYENPNSAKVNLTFNFTVQEDKAGHPGSAQISPGSSVLISLEQSNGELLLDQYELSIRQDGAGYMTAPLELPQGNYRLVDFMVVDESGKVVFASPRQSSVLSKEIRRSMPYSFAIKSNELFGNRIELISTQAKTPQSFGYDSFRRQQGSIMLHVFIKKDNELLRSSAEALIMKGLDTLRTYQISNNTNSISFSGDPSETYTLVVAKDSYTRFTQDFNTQQLNTKPLKVILEPALTAVGLTTGDQNYFAMQIDPAWEIFEYMVDWGDGTTENWTSGITTIIEHAYTQPGHYFVSVTGHGLDSLVLVGNIVGGGEIHRLGLEHIVNLIDFRIEYAVGPKVIDLSHNKRLNEIRIYPHPLGVSQLEELIIPNDAAIYNMEIGGNKLMKPESLNTLIDNLHHQVVNSPRGGDFWYSTYEDSNIPMVTPSAEALAKLQDLKNTYNWNVNPDPDMLLE